MTSQNNAERLARTWIELWNEGQADALPLAETFVHTSLFGRLEGREHYLETVKPMSIRTVTSLKVLKTTAGSNEAVIQFEMQTRKGTIQVCDWVTVEGDCISEIHSFYDATELR